MKRSIWFWVCFIVSVILAVYFASRIIMVGMGHGNMACVRNISVSADKKDKDLSAIAVAASVAPGTRAYSVDLNQMNAKIAAVPGVKDSAVRRLPNGNVVVRVTLHTAVALWTDGEHYFPLSADGTIVNKPTDVRDDTHVVFRGAVPDDIAEITKAAHNFVGRLDYLEWIEGRRWNLHTMNGIVVMLPERNPIGAIASLVTLNKNHKILDRDISVLDMRDEVRILVK